MTNQESHLPTQNALWLFLSQSSYSPLTHRRQRVRQLWPDFIFQNKRPVASIRTSRRKVHPKRHPVSMSDQKNQTNQRTSPVTSSMLADCCSRIKQHTHNSLASVTALAASSCSLSARLRPNPGDGALRRSDVVPFKRKWSGDERMWLWLYCLTYSAIQHVTPDLLWVASYAEFVKVPVGATCYQRRFLSIWPSYICTVVFH